MPRFHFPTGPITQAQLRPTHRGENQAAFPGSPKWEGLFTQQQVWSEIRKAESEEALIGPELHYSDSTGPRFCRPDFLFKAQRFWFILEVKRTYHSYASKQVMELYIPVAEAALQRRVFGIIACKYGWKGESSLDLVGAIQQAQSNHNRPAIWQL